MTEAAYGGFDLGTSGMKATLFDESGIAVARGAVRYLTSRPSAGASEQAPRDWVNAFTALVRELGAVVPTSNWRAIGLSGMIPTLVTLGPDGEPNGRAITWEDVRAETIAERLREQFGADEWYRRTGQWLDGRYLVSMFLRLAEEEPVRAMATHSLCSARDYLYLALTGELATDPSTAAGIGCYNLDYHAYDDELIAAANAVSTVAIPALPPVEPPAAARPLRDEIATTLGLEDAVICLGGADSVLGAHGLGVEEPGDVAYLAGTSNVILGATRGSPRDPAHRYLVTPLAEPQMMGIEMDLLATGSSISWLARMFGESLRERELLDAAEATDPRDAPIVLPYFAPGEQGALWDAELRGSVIGLELRHERVHLVRGLLNGIVLESRRCLEVLAESEGRSGTVKVAGGIGANDGFRRDLANASGRVVRAPAADDIDSSARGAARLAAQATGGVPLPSAPLDAPQHSPDPELAETWDELFEEYEGTRLALSAHYHAILPTKGRAVER